MLTYEEITKVKQSKHILSALTNLWERWDLRSTALPTSCM